jgi:hypothetical protein
MANSVFKLFDEFFFAAWLLKLNQVQSDELSPIHCTDLRKCSCIGDVELTVFLGHRDLFIGGECLSWHNG